MDFLTSFYENSIKTVLQQFDNFINSSYQILTMDLFKSDFYVVAMEVQAVIKPIAYTIIAIVFLIEFLKITIHMDVLKWEYGLRCFFKLVFAKVCIDASSLVLEAIYVTSSAWIKNVGAYTCNVSTEVYMAMKDEFDAGLSSLLGATAFMQIINPLMAIVMLCGLITNVLAYARYFEITVMIAVAPIPCAFLPADRSRITVKYFCNFAAACVSGLFMVICLKLFSQLCSDILIATVLASSATTVSLAVYFLVMFSILCVLGLVKSGTWAHRLFEGV